ncbi:MAG: hypothetical protein NVS9B15_10000 [Acidobacteriaceae bacterium]
MAGGAAVNVRIKSGTNSFHGSFHEFHTDQNFAARNYFQTDATVFPKKNRNNQNQSGGTFGGPILRDKLFFFGDYEGTTPTWFNPWADFLLELPTATGKARALFNPNSLGWTQWAGYVQDHWQASPKLTVTLGVRWEFYPFGYGDNGKGLRYLDLTTGNVLIGGYGDVPRNDGIDVGHGLFLPRLGVAYRVTPSRRLRPKRRSQQLALLPQRLSERVAGQ